MGTKWELASIGGVMWPAKRPPITLEFGAERLGGWSGCNTYGARWTVQGPRLFVLGPIQSTSLGCDEKGAWAQAKLVKVLNGDPAITPEMTDQLQLSTPQGVLVFLPS